MLCGPSIANCRVPSEPKHSTMCFGTAGSSGSLPRYQRREASRRNGSSTRAIQASLTPPAWRTRPRANSSGKRASRALRQRGDEIGFAHVDIDHGQIAVDLQAGRGQRAAIPRPAPRRRRRPASASPARSTACSRSGAASSRSPAWPGGRRCAPASDALQVPPERLLRAHLADAPDRASSRRRCRRRRRRGWSRAGSALAGRCARSPVR